MFDPTGIRVAIVAESQFSRMGLHAVLRRAPDIELVAEACDAEQAVEQAVSRRPDVVLIETLGDRSEVFGLVQYIVTGCHPASPAILLLGTMETADMVEVLRVGARGMVLVHTESEQLVHAVRLTAAGYFVFAPTSEMARSGYVPRWLTGRESDTLDRLSSREIDVLRLVARGLSNAEISAELSVGDSTVKSHVGRMLNKLGLPNRSCLAILAYESGLVSVD